MTTVHRESLVNPSVNYYIAASDRGRGEHAVRIEMSGGSQQRALPLNDRLSLLVVGCYETTFYLYSTF